MIELPQFDTGQYEGCELLLQNGEAKLVLKIAERPEFCISFVKVRWHQFTALPNCSSSQIKGSYFKLSDLGNTPQLEAFLASDGSATKVYKGLRHFCIFLDETGCHEFFAESAHVCP